MTIAWKHEFDPATKPEGIEYDTAPDTSLAFTFVMLMLLITDGVQRTASPDGL